MKIIELDEVDSTNEYCKRQNFAYDVAVIASRQTSGRGTKGRSFISSEGGLYVTTVRRYKNFPAKDAFKLLVNACVAVCKTLESFSVRPEVRWANDVLVGGLKISGTLIENSFGTDARSIVGIGININNQIPGELSNIATSLRLCTGMEVPLSEVRRRLLENLEKEYTIDDYKSYVALGRQVTVKENGDEYPAVVLDVCCDGRLEVKKADGAVVKLSSAEVSLRNA